VGLFAVQVAALLGASVTATARAADAPAVRSAGAARVLDYATEAFDAAPARYDVVFDTVGGETLERSYRVLRPGGRLITLQQPPSQEKAARHGATASFFVVSPDRAQLAHLARLADEGKLKVTVARTYPLRDGQAAYARRDARHAPGKTVLQVR
jgi:NADPH:quinone reductase-like Zn-dependent oxidoreductase